MTLSSAFCVSTVLLAHAGLPSRAAVTATGASANRTIASATWSVVGNQTGTVPYGTSPVAVLWPALNTQQYFYVVNAGSVALSATDYTISYAISSTIVGIGGQIDLQVCTGGAWNTTTGLCIGGTVGTLASTGATALTSPAPQPSAVGATLQVRALLISINVASSATISIGVKRTGTGTTLTS